MEECSAGLVVQDVNIRGRVLVREAAIQFVVCRDAMTVVFGLEWLHQNSVGFAMQGHHDVLVAASCSGRKASGVIRENVVDWDDLDVDGGVVL